MKEYRIYQCKDIIRQKGSELFHDNLDASRYNTRCHPGCHSRVWLMFLNLF